MDTDELNQTYRHATEQWCGRMLEIGTTGVEELASRFHQHRRPCKVVEKRNGSFNLCYKVLFEHDHTTWAVRLPISGRVMYPEEKIRREIAILEFLRHNTSIPVPRVVTWGASGSGVFMITEWIEGVSLTSVMEELPREEWGPVMRYDIDDGTLRKIYSQMAKIYLELWKHDFDKIGALFKTNSADTIGQDKWTVQYRPLTLKANEIQAGGNVSVDGIDEPIYRANFCHSHLTDHTSEPFRNATEYMNSLIEQNISHLQNQRNSIDDAGDARRKYIFRKRMKALVPHLFAKECIPGPFKLFCDDLRPGNVLVDPDTLEIKAVIDWEWTYTAPRQFLFSPPQWLILETPPTWTDYGESRYMEKLELFIQCLEDQEESPSTNIAPSEPSLWRRKQPQSRLEGTSLLWNGTKEPHHLNSCVRVSKMAAFGSYGCSTRPSISTTGSWELTWRKLWRRGD